MSNSSRLMTAQKEYGMSVDDMSPDVLRRVFPEFVGSDAEIRRYALSVRKRGDLPKRNPRRSGGGTKIWRSLDEVVRIVVESGASCADEVLEIYRATKPPADYEHYQFD